MTRSALNYDRDSASVESGLIDFGPSRTNQADALSADINKIVKDFGLTGRLPSAVRIPTYEDYDGVVDDYQTACNALREADASFLSLPAGLRARFHNSPQAFLEFCSKESNLDEMRSMGLAVPLPETPPVSPAPGPAKASKGPSQGPSDPSE